MKTLIKISIIALLFSNFLFSCTANDVTEGDILTEQTEEQAGDERKENRENPSGD